MGHRRRRTTRNELLKMLGNGVVPGECAAALRAFLWDAYDRGSRMTTILLPLSRRHDRRRRRRLHLVQMHREGCIDLHAHPALKGVRP